jgi:hypothetical protein
MTLPVLPHNTTIGALPAEHKLCHIYAVRHIPAGVSSALAHAMVTPPLLLLLCRGSCCIRRTTMCSSGRASARSCGHSTRQHSQTVSAASHMQQLARTERLLVAARNLPMHYMRACMLPSHCMMPLAPRSTACYLNTVRASAPHMLWCFYLGRDTQQRTVSNNATARRGCMGQVLCYNVVHNVNGVLCEAWLVFDVTRSCATWMQWVFSVACISQPQHQWQLLACGWWW